MQKWLIREPKRKLSQEQRQAYWEKTHNDEDYDSVYSLSEDPTLQNLVTADLPNSTESFRVLIPGCGSRTSLQKSIIKNKPNSYVICNDFPQVVRLAETRFNHSRVEYLAGDIKKQNIRNLDAVVHVTSVVSDSDLENRAIINSTTRSLREGGIFLGFFPTIFATLDLAYCIGEEWRASQLDLVTSSYNEPKQNVTQIFYTPARLRVILREAGLELDRMQIFFNEGKTLRGEAERHYAFKDKDAILYHLYVRALKKSVPS